MKNWLFSKANFYLLGVCAVLLVIGYVLLAQGPVDNPLSESVAPAILVIVYCGLIPYAILHGYREADKKDDNKEIVKKWGV